MVRFKHRWLLFELVMSDFSIDTTALNDDVDKMTSAHVYSAIRESLLLNFGEWGTGNVVDKLLVKYYSPTTRLGIIRTARDSYNVLWGALTFIKSINGLPCSFHVLHLSGSLLKIQQAAIALDREYILRYLRKAELMGKGNVQSLSSMTESSKQQIIAIEM